MRGFRILAIGLVTLLVAAACGGAAAPGTGTSAAAPAPAATAAAPAKPAFAAGTYMASIQTRGKLRVGTREDNVPFGLKSPISGKYEGFDIDIARHLARGIFGTAGDIDASIDWVPVVSATRIPTLDENKTDFVIATFTINEDRKKQIDFSDVYFSTGQKVMVKKTSTINGLSDLNGKTVCTAKGSTSEQNVAKGNPQAKLLLLDTYAPCLLALQQGTADAISTDETILFGLVKQDPNTKIVGAYFSDEPYGIGIKKNANNDRAGFADYMNAQLKTMITDGRWGAVYKQWITPVSSDEKKQPK